MSESVEFNDDLESLLNEAKEEPVKEAPPADTDKYSYSTVSLPSRGRLGYPEEVEYRDILLKDEKEISSATGNTFPKILNNVLKGLLKDQSYFEELTIHDRDYLLMWIWANNYSTVKTVDAICPHCDAKNRYEIDLTKLDILDLSDKYTHPFPYTTKSGEEVSLKLLTVKDEEIARKFCNSHKEYNEIHVMQILSINLKTVMQLEDKIKYVEENFTGKDMANVRGFHKYFKYGIVDTVEKECRECGEVTSLTVPFQVDFFIPTVSNDFG